MENIGIIGLSVMGSNLALNMADHNFKVAIYNRTREVTENVVKNFPHENLVLRFTLEEMVENLEKPRKVMLMVKAGEAVDKVIESLIPLLEKGDIIIDGGNSFFKDTQRRYDYLKSKDLNYFGVGVSGGEEGARHGPAIMPGGDEASYKYIQPILESIAAKVNNNPCCNYVSTGGAGHYVKMIHNGIEYGDMQLISEIYFVLKHLGGFSNEELHEIFAEFDNGELESYLIAITKNIFTVKENGEYLVDKILDRASQKGTGKWTAIQGIDLETNISVISSSLTARVVSSQKDMRVKAEEVFGAKKYKKYENREELVKICKEALYLAKVISYSQGFELLHKAEKKYCWKFDYSKIASIFRGGCIIQARLLQNIIEAYQKNNGLENLLFDEYFKNVVNKYQDSLRKLVILSVENGISSVSMASAISYLDSLTTVNGSANLIQAQRDYFGAHTFERTDKEGIFHFDWVKYINEK